MVISCTESSCSDQHLYLKGVQFRYSKLQFIYWPYPWFPQQYISSTMILLVWRRRPHFSYYPFILLMIHHYTNKNCSITVVLTNHSQQTDRSHLGSHTYLCIITKHHSHFIIKNTLRVVSTSLAYVPINIVASRRSDASSLSTASLEHVRFFLE